MQVWRGNAGRHLRGASSKWSGRYSRSSKPAGPMCRSIQAIPETRLSFMSGIARVFVLALSLDRSGKLPKYYARHRTLDRAIAGGEFRSDRKNPAPNRRRNDLAYVIYTSGSTGKPKGVESRTARSTTPGIDAAGAGIRADRRSARRDDAFLRHCGDSRFTSR